MHAPERIETRRLAATELTNSGHPAAAARRLRALLRTLGWTDMAGPGRTEHRASAARVLISLGLAEAEQGNTAQGLRILDSAATIVAERDLANLMQQRGLVLARAGSTAEALPLLDTAITLLGTADEPFTLACALLNRSMLHFTLGRIRPARQDLRWCGQVSGTHGFHLIGAKVGHNLGYCDLLEGDLPAALRAFEVAERQYVAHGPGCLPTLAMDKARALLAAGLAREADQELNKAFAMFRRDRLSADYAWSELTRAQAALLTGEFSNARAWATRAGRRFRRGSDGAWALVCDLTALRAALPGSTRPAALARRAQQIAARLRDARLKHDADLAELLAVRAFLAAGRVTDARAALRVLGPARRHGPLENRLFRQLVRAELAGTERTRGVVFRQVRAGLTIIERQRSVLGSVELRVGASALGAELAAVGLRHALDSGSASLVFAWSERCRAQALRTRPLRPPTDPETRDLLAELRQLSQLARVAEMAGRRDPELARRCARLERLVRDKDWQRRGSGEISRPTNLAAVVEALADAGRTMVSFVDHGGALLAVVIRAGAVRLHAVGDMAIATETTHRLRGDLDAQFVPRLPDRLAAAIRRSLCTDLDLLVDNTVGRLCDVLRDDDVVIVPPVGLTGVPWGLLPGLRGRPVTVALSAHLWVRARRAAVRHRPNGIRVLVAGPHLTHATAEVDAIAGIHPGAVRLTGQAATVKETLRALDGAELAHLAAHGHHQTDNVLFSHLDLADGPLMAYDMFDLDAAPNHVVLASCDVGQSAVRAGNEALGFTAALLHAGTSTVVSAVARVPDDLVAEAAVAYHRATAAGTSPAAALAQVTDASLVPLVCFGAG